MKKESGITLVALIITIVIMIILVTIVLAFALGNNGLINRARDSTIQTEKEQIKEQIKVELMSVQADKLQTGKTITEDEIENVLNKYGTVNKNDKGELESLTPTNKQYNIPIEEFLEIIGNKNEKPEIGIVETGEFTMSANKGSITTVTVNFQNVYDKPPTFIKFDEIITISGQFPFYCAPLEITETGFTATAWNASGYYAGTVKIKYSVYQTSE